MVQVGRQLHIYVKDKVKEKGLNLSEFESKLGYSKGYFANAAKNEASVGSDVIQAVKKEFPELNLNWLFTDEGSREVSAQVGNLPILQPEQGFQNNNYNTHQQLVPIYGQERLGMLNPITDDLSTVVTTEFISLPRVYECDGAIVVSGDAMYPIIKSGDFIGYTIIEDFHEEIYFGQIYIVSIQNPSGVFNTLAYVGPAKKSGKTDKSSIRLTYANQHHPDLNIKLEKVRGMALVKGQGRIHVGL